MTKKKTVGVLLSGCGFMDGSEIHEATLTLLALDRRGARVVAMAPDVAQADVVNHLARKPMHEARNVLAESARIARGAIVDLATVRAQDLDALVVPGGLGAAKNLCTWAREGAAMHVLPDVARLVTELHAAKKPLGFACIAPVIAAKVLGRGVRLTIGDADDETARGLEAMGARHVPHAPGEAEVDRDFRVATTPAYMQHTSIGPVFEGIDRMVEAVLAMA